MGLMTEAAHRILEYGFDDCNLHKIKAACVVENTASEKVIKKLNMRFIGVSRDHYFALNHWWDMNLYELLVSDWQK